MTEPQNLTTNFNKFNETKKNPILGIFMLALLTKNLREQNKEEKSAEAPEEEAPNLVESIVSAIMGFETTDEFTAWRDNAHANGWDATQAANNFDFSKFNFKALKGGKPILDLIAKHESGGNYNIAYGGKHVDLTKMTINEVRAWQKNYVARGSASSAVGRYQIIGKTLDGIVKKMGLSGNEKFDEAMQDKMALHLLDARGFQKFLGGQMDTKTFMKNLSMEWASLPKDLSGKSYYHGDGLNKALTTASKVSGTLDATRTAFQEDAKIASGPAPGTDQNTATPGVNIPSQSA